MANDHPFQNLFETLGRIPTARAESVNRQAYEILSNRLFAPLEKAGSCILLRAPRAGHGKTHLLSRIQHQLGATHEFVPLHAALDCRVDAASVTQDTLRRLVRQLPAAGGLTVLDLVARRLFASALQPLVGSGEVPCQDRAGALAALRNRPIETFDFHHPNAVTAHWAKENFEILGQRLSHELARQSGLPIREIAFWVGELFRYSSSPLENPNRVRLLTESLHVEVGSEMERLEALLGLLTLQVRVVLVADELEGFSTDETAALRLAAFIAALRQSVERLDVILSVNQDIWQSAFVPRLSGGLVDRLSEVVVELKPLTEVEMAALLDSRAPGLGKQLLGSIDLRESGSHARGLIRAAGPAWEKAMAQDFAPAVSGAAVETALASPESESAPVISKETPAFADAEIRPSVIKNTPLEPDFSPLDEISEPSPQSPFFNEPAAVASPAAPAEMTPPVFTPEPVAAAFFQTPQPISKPTSEEPTPVPAPSRFNPETAVAFSKAQESVFQAPPTQVTPPAAAPAAFQLPPDSPFEIIATEQPALPASSPTSQTEPTAPPPAAVETDRVDDLLRQFRERYGRGSL